MTESAMDLEFSRIVRESKYVELEVPKEPGTMNFWHGGNLDLYDDVIAQRSGRYEYGPGLYLTTHFETARKYAKGGRKMYLVTVRKGTDISDKRLRLELAIKFVNEFAMASKRKETIDFLTERSRDASISASSFLNELVNQKAIRPSNTVKLRSFLVANQIDYELVHSPFGWGETMMVLYNMDLIVSKKILGSRDRPTEYDLVNDF